ncbi:MAG: hypothetical protein RLZZ324_574 [Candidatus Parcubacteria bacterium]|jgi:hypothetical protein
MTRFLRRALTVFFILAFCITTPLVVLYTSGYSYSWKKHRVEKTGIIHAVTTPAKAAILLNGETQAGTTPYDFTRLLPEEYRVRFEAPGYFPWEKNVAVTSGETTFVTGTMVKDALPELRFPATPTASAFTDDAHGAAMITDDGARAMLVVQRSDRAAAVTLASLPTGAGRDAVITWAPDAAHVLLAHRSGTPGVMAYDALGNAPSADLSAITGNRVITASWSDDGSRAIAVTARGVYAVDPVTRTAVAAVPGLGIRDALMQGRTAYVLRAGEDAVTLERTTVSSTGPSPVPDVLATLPSGGYRFLHRASPYLLLAEDVRGRIIALSPSDGSRLDDVNGSDARWLAGAKYPLLAWNDFEITVANPASRTHQLVTRLSTPITGCAWHPSGESVFYATPTGIVNVDLDPREPKNAYELAKFTSVGAFAVDGAAGLLRFTGEVGNGKGLYERAF